MVTVCPLEDVISTVAEFDPLYQATGSTSNSSVVNLPGPSLP